MSFKDNISYDGRKVLYKGIDIGITRETLQDLGFYASIDIEYLFESAYREKLVVIRDKKIYEILK